MAAKRGPAASGSVIEDEFSMTDELEKAGWFARLWQVFAHDKMVNLLMLSAIFIGFFQGWLKYKLRAGWVTFAFDIPVTLAWLLCVTSVRRGRRLFPDCNMSRVLIALTFLGGIYIVLPFGVPWLVALASFRAWCFIPLVFLIGYHTTRSVRQMEVYLWLLIVLGAAASIYGLFQTAEEVQEMMKLDPDLNYRLKNQFYADSGGRSVFRRFSTFVSSAAFGGMMAYCTTFAVSRLVHPGCSILERIFLVIASVLMAYGVILSGARSAMSGLIVGLVFALWYRRGSFLSMASPIIIVVALVGGILWTGVSALERFSTLLDLDVLWQRLRIVVFPALESLSENPLGGGIGRSGHGVPFVLNNLTQTFEMRSVDGDLGRIAVDMGLPGLIVFGSLAWVGLTDSFSWMRKLKGSPLGLVGLPAGSMFMLATLQLSYGSPFLAIPGGVLLWFFLGSMGRLVEDYDKLVKVAGQEVADLAPQFVSFITQKRLIPLYRQDKQNRPRGARLPGLTGKIAAPAAGRELRLGESNAPTAAPGGRIASSSSASQSKAGRVGVAVASPAASKPIVGVAKRFLFRRPADSPDRRRPRR